MKYLEQRIAFPSKSKKSFAQIFSGTYWAHSKIIFFFLIKLKFNSDTDFHRLPTLSAEPIFVDKLWKKHAGACVQYSTYAIRSILHYVSVYARASTLISDLVYKNKTERASRRRKSVSDWDKIILNNRN